MLGNPLSSSAQPYDPSKINKKAVTLYNLAMERIEDGSYANAVAFLQAEPGNG